MTFGKEKVKVTLKELHDKYKKLLYLEDMKRIDVTLAVALSQKMEGDPLWLFIVGSSGDLKTEQVRAIGVDYTYYLHNISTKSLVNGYKNKTKYPDLAPKLNNKLVIITDFAQILSLPPGDRTEIYAQLRDLYDGYAGKASGMGGDKKYNGLKVTLIACSTPAIDSHILVNQNLGTRELIFRTKGSKNTDKLMEKCLKNEDEIKKIRKELSEITTNFIETTEIKREEIKPEVLDKIKKIALFTSKMRVCGEFDYYKNELRSEIYPEQPTRLVIQLKRLFVCLKSLSNDYTDEQALEILQKVAEDSSFPLRVKIYNHFKENQIESFEMRELMSKFRVGYGAIFRECCILYALGILNKTEEEYGEAGKVKTNWIWNKSVEDTLND